MLNLTEHGIYAAHKLQGQMGFIRVTGLRRFYKCYRVKKGYTG